MSLYNKKHDVNIGDIFGYLKVIGKDNTKERYYLCECLRCNNGVIKSIRKDHLYNYETIDCGCEKNRKHKDTFKATHNPYVIEDNVVKMKCSNSNLWFTFDLDDLDLANKYSWYEKDNSGYIYTRCESGKLLRFHRYILGLNNNDFNNGIIVDHIDGNPSNNRRDNLRICTASENMKNIKIRSNNKSGFMGVHYVDRIKRYHAYITVNGKRINLGYYKNINDAVIARKEAEEKYGFIIRE